jgi:hypothetical protein
MEFSALERLRTFRQGVFDLCSHRADALADVLDGAVTAGLVPSFAYLSLQTAHRRGHGSLYAALAKGRMDIEGVRQLVAGTLPKVDRPVYAIDTSTYIRSDAETSPERGIYYHSSRHSAGKPVVAGWSYSWCAQLGETSSSWTAPVNVSRVPIEVDAHDVAGQQMRAVITSLPTSIKPLFAFDAGYDPTRLAEQISEDEAAVLVRLRRNRCFYADPLEEQRASRGRPSTHGAKFVCNDPSTWPEPDVEHDEEDKGYGSVRVRAWHNLYGRVQNHPGRGTRKTKPVIRGMLVLLEVSKLPRETRKPRAFWLWWRGPGEPDLAFLWRAYVRRFDLEHTFRFFKTTLNWQTPRLRHPEQADLWSWLVLLAFTQLRLARGVVTGVKLPWQRPQERQRLTPSRVRRGFIELLPVLGTPASVPKPCGKSPGRPKGRLSGRAPRFPARQRRTSNAKHLEKSSVEQQQGVPKG